MAANPAFYGIDIACLVDADALFTSIVGLPVVVQDLYHRVTTASVLGPGGDDWGRDARRLLGMKESRALLQGPAFSAVVQRDPRVQTADVAIIKGTAPHAYVMTITGTTAAGPFRLVLGVSSLRVAILEAQSS